MMWLYAFIPAMVSFVGATWTAWRRPKPETIGAIQHFAAGVVFYAAAGEILPDATHKGAVWTIILGGALGIATMLTIRRLAEGAKERPTGLIAAATIDALIDGLVLGLGFNVGQKQGTMLAIALSIESLFLGLSVAGAFGKQSSRAKIIGAATGISFAVPLGVLIAQPIGRLPPIWQGMSFAFGLIALLYLVTEELLIEAHKKPETAWGPASFFVGFLAMTALSDAMGS